MQTTTHGVRTRRTFWWDRARPVDADVQPLRAVIFDVDAMADLEREPRAGLIDLVMSLFVAGIWVGVVSTRRRAWTETLVRQHVGEGLVETLVTVDDVDRPDQDGELYRLALWELGITAEDVVAVTGPGPGLRAATAAGLPAVVVTADDATGHRLTGAAEIRTGYEGRDPLLAADCQQLHRRWWVAQRRSEAA